MFKLALPAASRRLVAHSALPWFGAFFFVSSSAVAQAPAAPPPSPPAPAPAPAVAPSGGAPAPGAPAAAPAPATPDAPAKLDTPPAEPALGAAPATAAPAPAATPAVAPVDVAPVAAPLAPPPAEEDPKAAEWRERDHAVNESATLTGGVGLLHLQHAQSLAPGQFTLGFTTEYFQAGFLCTDAFPCPGLNGSGSIKSDQMTHIGGNLSLTMGLTEWLEGYAGTSAFANSDSANHPSLLQVLGDSDLGLKAYGHIGKILHVGGAAELWLINGTGSVGLAGGGTSAKFRGIATADLRGTEKHTPLRFSFNLTYSLDNTGDVISDTESARKTLVTRIERYGLGVNRVDHVDIGVGAEAFLVEDRIRPFIEYNILAPVNRQNYLCNPANPPNVAGDNCLATDTLAPSKLTIGGRFLPWKHGFAITAAIDIGITGQNDFIQEVAPIAPWTLYLGAGWGIDTWERPPVVETKVVEKEAPPAAPSLGHIKGYVDEAGHPETGVPNAIVSFVNHPEITSLATGPDGHFTTLGLPPGNYDLAVKADGYKDGTCTATIATSASAGTAPAPPPPSPLDDPSKAAAPAPTPAPTTAPGAIPDAAVTCTLEALPKVGKIVGHARDAETRNAISGVAIKVTDAVNHEFTATTDANGSFRIEGLAPAGYQVAASNDAYMNDVETVEVKPRQDTPVELVMMKRPKVALVSVTQKEVVIRQQVQFQTDSAVILPASTALLTEIADTLERNPRIHKVEIQGHTDTNGDDAHNQTLSEDRANAVRTWLVAHGVASDRLYAKGYGEQKPLVPNVTEANRARNRRVQFIIVDQDPANPGGKAKKP